MVEIQSVHGLRKESGLRLWQNLFNFLEVEINPFKTMFEWRVETKLFCMFNAEYFETSKYLSIFLECFEPWGVEQRGE